jgi:multicomponent Na+:H+ antiporter subunit D
VLNAAYLFPIVYRAFWRSSDGFTGIGEASPLMVAPLVATAGLSVLFGVWPDGLVHLYDLARAAAAGVFGA